MATTTAPADTTAPATTPAPVLDLALLSGENDREVKLTAAEKHVPAEVKAWVERGHESWKAKPKVWREIELASEDAIKELLKLARHFAKSSGRTIRVKKQGDAKKLVYKITDPPSANDDTAAE